MPIETYISVFTLKVNGPNASNKRLRQVEWIQKAKPVYILSMVTRDPHQT